MKKIFLTLTIFLLTVSAFSQEAKFKGDLVYIDGKECLKIDDSDPNNVVILDLNGKEIIYLKYIRNSRYGGLYNKIIFVEQGVSFTSLSYIYTKKLLFKRLLSNKMFENCILKAENIDKFILKYDENVEKG